MTLTRLHNIVFLLDLFVIFGKCANLNVTGEAATTRYWDCCKPSCGWRGKAAFSRPVLSCSVDDKPTDIDAGTGCGDGGSAYSCSDQQPWAINDTFSYGFAGAYLTASLTGGHVEDNWCCACYQLDFTSDPLRGKSMIIQASNTAYDVTTTNRFSLAMPGGNTTSHDACARQYGVDQTVFGQDNAGVNSVEDCDNLPEQLRQGCKWRFDWFEDASYPSATFKRVVCPTELTDKTQCIRDDEKVLSGEASSAHALSPLPASSMAGVLVAIVASLISV